MNIKNTTDLKYYHWLLYAVGASLLSLGGFVYAKGGGLPLLFAALIEWVLRGLISGVVSSLIVAGVSRAMKKNYKNAFWGSFAIFVFISACITIAQLLTHLK